MTHEKLARWPVLGRDLGDSRWHKTHVGHESKPVFATEQAESMGLVYRLYLTTGLAEQEH